MKTLFYNGSIYSGEEFYYQFVVEDGIFKSVKKDKELCQEDYDSCINLEGKFVCAGFNDSHMHVLNYGQALSIAQLHEHTSSIKELIDYGKEFLHTHNFQEGQWLRGRGFNQDYFKDEKRMPNKDDLDLISKDIPILFTRACGHCCILNSKGLELAHITKDTQDILGGEIGRDANGEPNGIFYDNANNVIEEYIPKPSIDEIKEMIMLACKELNRFGITSAQSDDYSTFFDLPFELINAAYQELEKEGKLTVRIYEQANFITLEELKRFIDTGLTTGKGSDHFKIGPLKMLGDGSLGSRTAHLSIPYKDAPTTQGFNLFSDQQMEEMIAYANAHHMQIAVHAIGDACLDQVLSSLDKALQANPKENHRHGIVHTQITRKDQLERMAKLNLHSYIQSIFLDYDIQIVEDRVGKELARTSYNWKTLQQLGIHVSNGSDAPVEIPDVMKGIQCAVTRKTIDGLGPYLKEEAFTIKEAIDSFTKEGAYASFEEKKKGQIKEGYFADFVILEKNPFLTKEEDLHKIVILNTYLNGKQVY